MSLFIEDLEGLTDEDVRNHIVDSYEVARELVDMFDILIAYESVGNYGCDSSSFFLLRDRKTGTLFENHGSHCSCYGFEGQWGPEETTVEYLKSDKFYFSNGGYDGDPESNRLRVLEFINTL